MIEIQHVYFNVNFNGILIVLACISGVFGFSINRWSPLVLSMSQTTFQILIYEKYYYERLKCINLCFQNCGKSNINYIPNVSILQTVPIVNQMFYRSCFADQFNCNVLTQTTQKDETTNCNMC